MNSDWNKSKTEISPSIAKAVQALKEGGVVAIPTETVYGLAAKITSDSAIRKIFSTKDRPFFDPLIVHVTSVEQAKTLVKEWPQSAQILAEAFWPGPLTLVLPKNNSVTDLITSGLETVGLRCPRHPMARAIIENLGEPVAAPSANRFGRTSPSTAQHVADEFKNKVLVVDGGPCEVGIESTIVKLNESHSTIDLTLLRAGAIVPEQMKTALENCSHKQIIFHQPGRNIEAPGQVKHHYMPTIPVLSINRTTWDSFNCSIENVNLHLGASFLQPCFLNLNSSPEQAARELYSELRKCSTPPHDVIVFIKDSHHQGEYWAALLDRLNRASTYSL